MPSLKSAQKLRNDALAKNVSETPTTPLLSCAVGFRTNSAEAFHCCNQHVWNARVNISCNSFEDLDRKTGQFNFKEVTDRKVNRQQFKLNDFILLYFAPFC